VTSVLGIQNNFSTGNDYTQQKSH